MALSSKHQFVMPVTPRGNNSASTYGTVLLSCLIESVLQAMLQVMDALDIAPNTQTLSAVLNAHASLGKVDEAKSILKRCQALGYKVRLAAVGFPLPHAPMLSQLQWACLHCYHSMMTCQSGLCSWTAQELSERNCYLLWHFFENYNGSAVLQALFWFKSFALRAQHTAGIRDIAEGDEQGPEYSWQNIEWIPSHYSSREKERKLALSCSGTILVWEPWVVCPLNLLYPAWDPRTSPQSPRGAKSGRDEMFLLSCDCQKHSSHCWSATFKTLP